MEYKLGNSMKIYHQGETVPIVCPKCHKKVKFSVFSNIETRLKAKFPPLEIGYVYFLICPHCSSVFGINEETGDTFVKGEEFAIGNYDLKELKKFEL